MNNVETITKKESMRHASKNVQFRQVLHALWMLFSITLIVFTIVILSLVLGILSIMEIFSVRSALSVLQNEILVSSAH
tara:strand:+ start:250 stop:483 length:234 start_codon:yes stop_codon:yes gene_type:complete